MSTLTIGGFIVGVSPFLAFEVRHGFANTRSILQFVLAGKDTGYSGPGYFSIIGDVMFRLFSRLLYRIPPYDLFNNYPKWYVQTLIVLSVVTLAATILFVGGSLVRKMSSVRAKLKNFMKSAWITQITDFKQDSYLGLLLLFLWGAVVVLLFGFYKKAIYDYYFGIIFPLPFLFTGLLFSRMGRLRYGKIFSIGATCALLFFNWQGRPFIYPPNNQLEQVENISKIALSKTDGKPFNFALITAGNSDHAYRYFFEIWGRKPVTIENTDVDPSRKTVTDQLIIICETGDCHPLGNSLWEIAGFGRAQIAGTWDAPFVKIYKLVHFHGNE